MESNLFDLNLFELSQKLKIAENLSIFKSHCQQEPHKLESGGLTDRPATIFFLSSSSFGENVRFLVQGPLKKSKMA